MAATPGKKVYRCGGVTFEVDERYVIEKTVPLGQGAYGTVCAATDTLTGKQVAIKRIANVFDHPIDAKRTLRELKLLNHLAGHENIVQLLDIMVIPSDKIDSYNEIYIVTDLMDTDLHQICKSKQALTDQHFQHFVYQILRALKYIHSANVLHRDLKPSNLVLNANCDMKVIDFGLARPDVPSQSRLHHTEYVATRWYRAPEIIYNNGAYSKAVDIWAVGCIFAELLGRAPMFPGKDQVHQLSLILNVVGTPTPEQLAQIRNTNARNFIASFGTKPAKPVSQLLPNASAEAVDLISRMISAQPEDRPSAEEALAHPYLAELHDPEDEPVCTPFADFDFENEALTVDMIRRCIYNESLKFHPELGEYQSGTADIPLPLTNEEIELVNGAVAMSDGAYDEEYESAVVMMES